MVTESGNIAKHVKRGNRGNRERREGMRSNYKNDRRQYGGKR